MADGELYRRCLNSVLTTVLLLSIGSALAEEPLPDIEFLEFLGEWEADDGNWLDPILLLDIENNKPAADPQQENKP